MAGGKINGTVRRTDITLSETRVERPGIGDWRAPVEYSIWDAIFDGTVVRDGTRAERLTLTRTSEHAGEALLLLEEALNELGLEVR